MNQESTLFLGSNCSFLLQVCHFSSYEHQWLVAGAEGVILTRFQSSGNVMLRRALVHLALC